ncbi:BTAD domain-containing putative transcriptional regulator [Microbacter sp. GSS18]|nr:BTAD domain-containing putative transcriptional regulator [Microbacter sp. GSS18]
MLRIHLIGRPAAERDGVPIAGPRGHKSWALLARLTRSADPVSRQVLVDELFAEADDPFATLRWTLAELRRSLGAPDAFAGNPVALGLDDAWIDVRDISPDTAALGPVTGGFLDGIDVRGSAGFESWLLVERSRIDGEISEALRQAALRALSARQHGRAIELGQAMVARTPLDEGAHVLLVKALASAGEADAAERQVAAAEAVFLDETGVPPSPALRDAARTGVASPALGIPARATATTLLQAGIAAVAAGAADAGVECLRGASAAAESAEDPALYGRCLTELGTALVHSVRGYDDEGAIVLRHGADQAQTAGDEQTEATALGELAYLDVIAGRRANVMPNLRAARELHPHDAEFAARLAGFEAMHLSDMGRLAEASDRFAEAAELARAARAPVREAWILGVGSRTHYLLGRYDLAEEWADRSCELAEAAQWNAFLPWPQAWRAHVLLARGDEPAKVRDGLSATFAMACQIGDPCWEAISAKALALTYLDEGDHGSALEWLARAMNQFRRKPDTYMWVAIEILVTEAQAALGAGDLAHAEDAARRAVAEAATHSMDELLGRALAALTEVGTARA